MALPVIFDSIPAEPKTFKNWVLWKLEERDGKNTKIPYQTNEKRADSTNPDTWNEYDYTKSTLIRTNGKFSGLGFVFSQDTGIIGIDWDHVINPETGEWDKEILDEVKLCGSYAELSQSGTGAHVLIKGKIPGDRRRKGDIEMYSKERFFVVTGQHIEGTKTEINENQDAINKLYKKRFGDSEPKKAEKKWQPIKKSPELSDADVLNLCRNAKNAEKFNSLYAGNIKGFASQSEADLSLCSIIAFYTQNQEQLNKLFCGSKLFRDKWDREDYGAKTLEKAILGLTEVYDPEKKTKGKSGEGEPERISVPFDVVADQILKDNHIFSMRDNKQIYIYKDGVYKNEGIEAILDTEIRDIHNAFFVKYWNNINPGCPLPHIQKATTKYVREVLDYIRAYTHIIRDSIEEDQAKYINFKNWTLVQNLVILHFLIENLNS